MKRSLSVMAAGIGVAVVLAGCGGGAPAQPGSLDKKPSNKPSSNNAGAPKVARPLDVEQYKQDPCGLVPPETIAKLGLSSKPEIHDSDSGGSGKDCSWKAGSHEAAGLSVSLTGMGLDAQYQKQKVAQAFPYFKPTTVSGYPAIIVEPPNQGSDDMILALNDHEAATIRTGSDPNTEPEYSAKIRDEAAKAIIATARSGGK